MLDKLLRAAILCSAGASLVCRYIAFKAADALGGQTVKLLNGLSYAAIAVLIVCGIIFAITVKRTEKRTNAENAEESGEENAADEP